MSNPEEYIPRFAFQVKQSLKDRADRVFNQYGMRRAIFEKILEEVLDIIEEEGPMAIGILIAKDVKPSDVIPTLHKAKEVNK